MKFEASNDKYLTAIFFDAAGKSYKYRNIPNTEKGRGGFERFAKEKKAEYINYYHKESKQFSHQQKI